MGLIQTLHYRSSQRNIGWMRNWLVNNKIKRKRLAIYLFALHTLWKIETIDEITQSRLPNTNLPLSSWCLDGIEKEFRGFGCVEMTNAESFKSEEDLADKTPSALTRQWFLTGKSVVDTQMPDEFWQGDDAAFPLFSSIYTR